MFCVVSMHMDILKSFYISLWSRIRQVKPSNQEARKSVCQRDIAIKQKRWRQMMMGKTNRASAKHLYLFPFFKKKNSLWIYFKMFSCFILLHFSFHFLFFLWFIFCLHSLILCLFVPVTLFLITCQVRFGKKELSSKMSKSNCEKTHICTLYRKCVRLYTDRI